MPQATDELRSMMERYFGDRINDFGPTKHLQERGYKLGEDWYWTPPEGITYETMPEKEYHCLLFLVQEWDFGGLTSDRATT